MKISKQDLYDSFNLMSPKKYINARLKIAPYVIMFALVISFVLVLISTITGYQFFQK